MVSVGTRYFVDRTTGELTAPNRTLINLTGERELWAGDLHNTTDAIELTAADMADIRELNFIGEYDPDGNYDFSPFHTDQLVVDKLRSVSGTAYLGSGTGATKKLYMYFCALDIKLLNTGITQIKIESKGYVNFNDTVVQFTDDGAQSRLLRIIGRFPFNLTDEATQVQVTSRA